MACRLLDRYANNGWRSVGRHPIYYKMVIHFYKSGADRTAGPVKTTKKMVVYYDDVKEIEGKDYFRVTLTIEWRIGRPFRV